MFAGAPIVSHYLINGGLELPSQRSGNRCSSPVSSSINRLLVSCNWRPTCPAVLITHEPLWRKGFMTLCIRRIVVSTLTHYQKRPCQDGWNTVGDILDLVQSCMRVIAVYEMVGGRFRVTLAGISSLTVYAADDVLRKYPTVHRGLPEGKGSHRLGDHRTPHANRLKVSYHTDLKLELLPRRLDAPS